MRVGTVVNERKLADFYNATATLQSWMSNNLASFKKTDRMVISYNDIIIVIETNDYRLVALRLLKHFAASQPNGEDKYAPTIPREGVMPYEDTEKGMQNCSMSQNKKRSQSILYLGNFVDKSFGKSQLKFIS